MLFSLYVLFSLVGDWPSSFPEWMDCTFLLGNRQRLAAPRLTRISTYVCRVYSISVPNDGRHMQMPPSLFCERRPEHMERHEQQIPEDAELGPEPPPCTAQDADDDGDVEEARRDRAKLIARVLLWLCSLAFILVGAIMSSGKRTVGAIDKWKWWLLGGLIVPIWDISTAGASAPSLLRERDDVQTPGKHPMHVCTDHRIGEFAKASCNRRSITPCTRPCVDQCTLTP